MLGKEILRYIDKGGRDPEELSRMFYNMRLNQIKEICIDQARKSYNSDEMDTLMSLLDSWRPH